jgi:hypothetical protein
MWSRVVSYKFTDASEENVTSIYVEVTLFLDPIIPLCDT